ncbi:hypothetical protein EU245_05625 [Lentibacillus lipolyticus]|nr:hypothetical protein EU245_05625 [Lentibacillus lipolyticus]
MAEVRLSDGTREGTNKEQFANAITVMADQLRLMEQKIAMAADKSVRDQFRVNKDELSRTQVRMEKLMEKNMYENKKMSPHLKILSLPKQNKNYSKKCL